MAKTRIQLRVEELRKPIVQHIQADRVRWLQEIQRCAFFDIRQFMTEAGDLKLLQDVDQEHLAAIAGLEVIPELEGTGESRVQIGFRKKFRLTDHLDALELFGKAMGFLNVKEQPGLAP